jgi:hypothetical protein
MDTRIDFHPTHQHGATNSVPGALSLRQHPGTGRRQLFDQLRPRHRVHPGALRERRARAMRGNPLPGHLPHRQRLVHGRLRSRLRAHRVRLSHGRPLGSGSRTPLRPFENTPRSLRQGDRRPDGLGHATRLERHLPATCPPDLRGLRLGRRPPPGNAARRPGDLRTAHAQFHRPLPRPASSTPAPMPASRRRSPI